jgi:hypothetical protein
LLVSLEQNIKEVLAMGILLAFAPWILFWILASNDTFRVAIFAALISTVVINIRYIAERKVKVLDLGTMIFFALLSGVSLFADPPWLEQWVHVLGNLALTVIALVSIAIGKPFTIQYAKEQVAEQYWNTPQFLSTNLRITWVWFATFAVQTVSSAITIIHPQHETWLSWVIPTGAFVAAIKFTAWYPQHVKEARQRLKES